MITKKKLVSIVIPAYNEEETIALVLKDTIKEIKKLSSKYNFQIILTNNRSTDRTKEIAKKFPITITDNKILGTKGANLRNGFSIARGEYIIMLDADYSHIPEDIPNFLSVLEDGATLVIGSRKMGGSDEYTGIRGFGNELLTWLFRMFFGVKLTDVLNGYKAFHRKILEIPLKSPGFEIEIELVKNALLCGGSVVEINSHERARAGGEMKSHALREGFRFASAIIKHGIAYRLSKLKKLFFK